MYKKLFLLLFLSAIFIPVLRAQGVPAPTLLPGEAWTKVYSTSYDYQTNGSVRYLLQRPTNSNSFFAMMMGVEDSTDNTSWTSRGIWYGYTTNNGTTWDTLRAQPLGTRMGFGNACLVNGIPVIAFHGGSPTTARVIKDALWGTKAFSDQGLPIPAVFEIWPHVAGNNTGKIVVEGCWNANAGT